MKITNNFKDLDSKSSRNQQTQNIIGLSKTSSFSKKNQKNKKEEIKIIGMIKIQMMTMILKTFLILRKNMKSNSDINNSSNS